MPDRRTPPVDYYAALQVHPDADSEVIEAAYRQLMKKHHPDVAGGDPVAAAEHHRRAKVLNEAFRVLRDPEQRRFYDTIRIVVGVRPPPPQAQPKPGPAPDSGTSTEYIPRRPSRQPVGVVEPVQVVEELSWTQRGPLGLLTDAYYLLPGPYEWETDRTGEWLLLILVPMVGVLGFALATDRLTPLLGTSWTAGVMAWVFLGIASLPILRALPRVALAAGPSILLISMPGRTLVEQAHVPAWLIWAGLSLLSLTLSARLYVFAILPTMLACWLLVRLT